MFNRTVNRSGPDFPAVTRPRGATAASLSTKSFPWDCSRTVIHHHDADLPCPASRYSEPFSDALYSRRVPTRRVRQVKRWSGRLAASLRPMYAPTPISPAGATYSARLFFRFAGLVNRASTRAPPSFSSSAEMRSGGFPPMAFQMNADARCRLLPTFQLLQEHH